MAHARRTGDVSCPVCYQPVREVWVNQRLQAWLMATGQTAYTPDAYAPATCTRTPSTEHKPVPKEERRAWGDHLY